MWGSLGSSKKGYEEEPLPSTEGKGQKKDPERILFPQRKERGKEVYIAYFSSSLSPPSFLFLLLQIFHEQYLAANF